MGLFLFVIEKIDGADDDAEQRSFILSRIF
jgi:hypothetical protein